MMAAPSLPSQQASMPAGFTAFLTAIGQLPAEGGEAAGFDQLLAAAPTAATAAATGSVTVRIEQPLPAEGSSREGEAAPVETRATPVSPATGTGTGDADAAAALATTLLIALGGGAAISAPAPGKADPVKPDAETDTTGEPAEGTIVELPADRWLAAVAAVPATGKPAKPAEAASPPAEDTPPAAPGFPRPRDAAPPPLPAGVTGAVSQAAKADIAPSMTILFNQPAAPAAAALAATAPVQVAERVLDMGSDTLWIDQLARDIAATKSDDGDISFRLMPRHLGRLDVAMKMGDEGMALKMDTHHEATATIVTAAQAKLVDELRQQGVRVTGAEVTCTPGETGRQSQGQNRAAAPDPAHLIETATERAEPRDEDRAANRRGRFA